MTPDRVTATPEALELIGRLRAKHGPIVLIQSGGCCDGSAPQCLRHGELLLGPGDRRVGVIAGVDVYVDSEQYRRWGEPVLAIDVAQGAGDTFSLEGLEGVQFILAAPVPEPEAIGPPSGRPL